MCSVCLQCWWCPFSFSTVSSCQKNKSETRKCCHNVALLKTWVDKTSQSVAAEIQQCRRWSLETNKKKKHQLRHEWKWNYLNAQYSNLNMQIKGLTSTRSNQQLKWKTKHVPFMIGVNGRSVNILLILDRNWSNWLLINCSQMNVRYVLRLTSFYDCSEGRRVHRPHRTDPTDQYPKCSPITDEQRWSKDAGNKIQKKLNEWIHNKKYRWFALSAARSTHRMSLWVTISGEIPEI